MWELLLAFPKIGSSGSTVWESKNYTIEYWSYKEANINVVHKTLLESHKTH